MSAASQARRRRPDDLEILAFEKGRFTSYSACGIPYLVGGVVEDAGKLITRKPEKFRADYSIDVRLRQEVVEVDLDKRAVKTRNVEEHDESWEGFDDLVVATGAVPVRPQLPGSEAEGIFGVQVLDDGIAIERWIEQEQRRHAVVVGGGYIGLEMAEALLMRGIDVTLVEMSA